MKMDINWVIFVILLILGGVLGLIYLLYCHLKKRVCPICDTPETAMEQMRTNNNS